MGTFWYASYDDITEEENPYDKVNNEDVFYQQFEMIHSLRDGLFEERHDKTDLYFLGFSSYATQDVFYKEVKYAQALMDSRFDTSGRSALLINHLKTYETEPLANSHNLKIMLDGISEHMNIEQDILFLYLTSHGSKEHNLSVDFWPLNLNDLTPELLKEHLDESGIKWRIIVISSCYSGGYIKHLEDDNTLVFTASAADKQSFGCSNENEFTWFGEAIFKFALNKNASIVDGFEQAKIYIQDKEKLEKVESSQPQLSIGKNIESKLRQYTAEIEKKHNQTSSIEIALKNSDVKKAEEIKTPENTVILNN
ncbi:MAG: C13 family peptidase [Gammaproteobacteria bacterium]|nr:C13 family peptidase [Gammaproteobacteria bacterium]